MIHKDLRGLKAANCGSWANQRVTADPADGKLKINVVADPMIFFQITVPEFVVSGESFDILVEAYEYDWDYEGGIPQIKTDYAQDCTLFFEDANYTVVPASIAAADWANGQVTKTVTVTTTVEGESQAELTVQSDINADYTGSATLAVHYLPPPVEFDVQSDVWQLLPTDGETALFNLTAIARQLNKPLPDYSEQCVVSSSVGSVVIQGRETPHIEPEDWADGVASVTMKLTGIPTPSFDAVITVAEVGEPANQGHTTVLLKVPEHTKSAWRYLPANALVYPIDAGDTRKEAYAAHTPELWYSMLNATRGKADGDTYYAIPSGYYGMEFTYAIQLQYRGYPVYRYEHSAREIWYAYVWDLEDYVGQELNYLVEIGELRAAFGDNAETTAPIIYQPGDPGWYEHDWENAVQTPMPNWTVSFRYDFWTTPRSSWNSAYLQNLPSAHTTTVGSLVARDGSPYYIRLPFTTAPQRYLFFCPHIHLGGFPFDKPRVKNTVSVELLHTRSLRIWSH
ncbi:MAG TPA: hypothetical protein VM141_05920 [Planctomycetota bacterium]|nr:hypothetical protein [Planctomycetota bacterium]